jgi:hypothetical protein
MINIFDIHNKIINKDTHDLIVKLKHISYLLPEINVLEKENKADFIWLDIDTLIYTKLYSNKKYIINNTDTASKQDYTMLPNNCYVLDVNPENIFTNIHYFNSWGEKTIKDNLIVDNSKANIRFLASNRKPRPHRNSFAKLCYLFQNNLYHSFYEDPNRTNNDERYFENSKYSNIFKNYIKLPVKTNDTYYNMTPIDLIEKMKLTQLTLIFETNYNVYYSTVTEKTFREIVSKRPFILFGPYNALQNLKNIGFKTFETIWDESYDNLKNPTERFDKTIDLLLELNSMNGNDFNNLILKTKTICEYNYHHAQKLHKINLQNLKDKLLLWKNT